MLNAGCCVADGMETGGFGGAEVGPLWQTNHGEGNEVLGNGLLLGGDAFDAAEVNRLGGVVLHDRNRCCLVGVDRGVGGATSSRRAGGCRSAVVVGEGLVDNGAVGGGW